MPEVRFIATDKIQPNPYQPRISFDQQGLQELADSIKHNGLIQPIVVRQVDRGYELIAGERRLKACQSLKMATIPALLIDASETQAAQLALIENIQRQDLSAIEEAKAYLQMIRMSGLTQDALAAAVGKTQSTIANKLRLLNLSQACQDAISQRKITERHGRALLRLDADQQIAMLHQIMAKNMTVQQTEQLIEQKYFSPAKASGGSLRCFGASIRIGINTIRQAVASIKKLGTDVKLDEKDGADAYVMTITIKK